jgi:(p)ppGpp synthase/HD superfamily hydrolase
MRRLRAILRGGNCSKVASSHLPYITHPSEVAALLLEVAR